MKHPFPCMNSRRATKAEIRVYTDKILTLPERNNFETHITNFLGRVDYAVKFVDLPNEDRTMVEVVL